MNKKVERNDLTEPYVGIDDKGQAIFHGPLSEVLNELGLSKDDLRSGRVSSDLLSKIIRARIGGRKGPSKDSKDGRE